MLPIKLRFIWQSGFRGEYLKKSTNQKQELPLVAMFFMDRGEIGNLQRGPAIDASTKFRIIWPNSFRGEEFKKSPNQKQESPVAAIFVNGLGKN